MKDKLIIEELQKAVKNLRSDLFYQLSSKFDSEMASKYPSIEFADILLDNIKDGFRNHPELEKGEIFIINVNVDDEKEMIENFSKQLKSIRLGKVAYTTNFTKVVNNMKPLFGKYEKR